MLLENFFRLVNAIFDIQLTNKANCKNPEKKIALVNFLAIEIQ